jgi:hypothetical protein
MSKNLSATEQAHRILARKIYPGALSMAKNHRVIFFASLPFSIVGLNGPIFGKQQDHNGFVFLGGSILCPLLAALVLTIMPFQPYRSSPFAFAGNRPVDTRDPRMLQLANIFKSSSARQFLWRSTSRLILVLLVLMGALAVVVRNALEWSWKMPDPTVGLTLMACYLSLAATVMDWGFNTYSSEFENS